MNLAPGLWSTGAVPVLAVFMALALDRALGEPPARWHPVVAMGRYLGFMGRRVAPAPGATRPGPARAFVQGALAWGLGAALVSAVAVALALAVQAWAWWAQALALGVLLKPLLSWRMLRDEVLAVEGALGESLATGRARLAWLVSRDVDALDASQVRESAIESLAENLNDSVVAPLFWFLVAGLPGAALYRFANTADAMWGYRGERQGRDWTWAGKWAARMDDILSWLPARITAALLMGAGGCVALGALWREARRTPSPNSGWPMAALALALQLRLRKPGVYTINEAGHAPEPADTTRAIVLAARALTLGGVLLFALWLLVEGLP